MQSKFSKIVLFVFMLMVLMVPTSFVVKADTSSDMDQYLQGMPIVSKPTASVEQMEAWARKNNATDTFIGLAKVYYQLAPAHGRVNPVLAYAQAAKETGYGKFGGVLNESYKNPCGLKNTAGGADGDASAHMRFNTWEDGISAHLDHLALYAGVEDYPRKDTLDPRHFPCLRGKARVVTDLGGKWAPSASYGVDVVNMTKSIETGTTPNILPSRLFIDSPKQGEVYNKEVRVGGWSLNYYGVKKLNIYLNDNLVKETLLTTKRPDVNAAFPGYDFGVNSGFYETVDLSNALDGNNVIKVEAIGNNGEIVKEETNIYVSRPEKYPARLFVDSPHNGDKIDNKDLVVTGWALNPTGVKNINIYLNNKLVKQLIDAGISRPDVDEAFPGYPNGDKSGFFYAIPAAKVPQGKNSVKVEFVGNDGAVKCEEMSIDMIKKSAGPARIFIDKPVRGETIDNKSVVISGWALHPAGVEDIKIYINDKLAAATNTGIGRPDVDKAFPGYPNGDRSGYNYSLSPDYFAFGKNKVTVEAVGSDGSSVKETIEINFTKPGIVPYIRNINVDSSSYDSDGKAIKVSVDAEGRNPLYRFKIYDGASWKVVQDYSNSDIYNWLPEKDGGYKIGVDIKASNSSKDSDHYKEVSYNLVTAVKYRLFVDSPKDGGESVQGTNILRVEGWALSVSGIKEIQVFIDSKLVGNGNVGNYRPDVDNAFPGYPSGQNSGFVMNVDISDLKPGSHTIEVKALSNDGNLQTIKINHIIKSKSKTIVLDPGHNYGGDDGAYATHNGVTYSERDLNMQLSLKIKKYLEKYGFNVILTREENDRIKEDSHTSLQKRVDIANKANADLFISIHHDKSTGTSASGISTHYSSYRPSIDNEGIEPGNDPGGWGYDNLLIDTTPSEVARKSKELANRLVNKISSSLNYKNLKAHDHGLFVTRYTNVPSVLIECGFISNPNEVKRCASDSEQDLKAKKIACIVHDFLINDL